MEMLRYIKRKVGIPSEYMNDKTIEFKNSKLKIYNYEKINELSNEIIDLTFYNIIGENLVIDELTSFHILISGKIKNLEFKNV